MIRSGTCMMIGSLFLTLSLTTLASTPPAFDPRDPAIWEEEIGQHVSAIRLALRSVYQLGMPGLGR